MTSCRRIAALGASLMWSLTGCSVPAEPTSDWHPSSVTDYTIPSAGTPPPGKSLDSRPDPFGITAGPDGNIWFTESEFNRIGKITPDGHITQFPLPVDDDVPDMHPEPVDIVCGGDGALWFATLTGLGRSTTDGRITMYPDAGDLTEDTLSHIAPAQDGVWVLHESLGHVGKNGVLTWYKHPYDPRKWMQSIFAGPHHHVLALTLDLRTAGTGWRFSISDVLPNGSLRKMSTFTLQGNSTGPAVISSIVAAPDGTFWMSEGGGQTHPPYDVNIDQVFADGSLVRRATLQSAYHVANGPRGTVLVQGLDFISKLSSDGARSTFYPHFQHDGGLSIGSVTAARDGTIWFTKADGTGRIAKIVP